MELGEGGLARRLFGDLTYRSDALRWRLAELGILLAIEGTRQQMQVCFAHLKRTFGQGETLATMLVGLAIRIAAKVPAYTYGLYVNQLLVRPQGRIKELWV